MATTRIRGIIKMRGETGAPKATGENIFNPQIISYPIPLINSLIIRLCIFGDFPHTKLL